MERSAVKRSTGAGRKLVAVMATALFALAQPRMFCAVHCMILDHLEEALSAHTTPPGDSLASDPASASSTVDSVCAQVGTIITSMPSIPVGTVGPATLPGVRLPVFGGARPEAALRTSMWTPIPAAPLVDPPPPRA